MDIKAETKRRINEFQLLNIKTRDKKNGKE